MKQWREVRRKVQILTPPMPWHKASLNEGERGTVVLLHGLWRSKSSMTPMADYLHQQYNLRTICLPYESVTKSYQEVIDDVLEQLEQLNVSGEISFVTHSLGGIILRGLLANKERQWSLNKAVMLAPPHKGSQIIDWLSESPLRFILGPAGDYLMPSKINEVVPSITEPEKISVIMGSNSKLSLFGLLLDADNDGIVSVNDGRLEGLAQFSVTNCDHTFITADEKVQQLTGDFLIAAESKKLERD